MHLPPCPIHPVAAAVAIALLTPAAALACPVCFGGDPDSAMIQSARWAVLALLGVTAGVLSGFVGFIFHLIKRARQAHGNDGYADGPAA